MASERFNREAAKPWLAEAPPVETPETELEPGELLTRLERHAAESGRLEGRVQILERAMKAEREARRRLGQTLQRERVAAQAIHERAERDRAQLASATEELERTRQALGISQRQVQTSWTRALELEQQLVWKDRPLWRKLLRRPPAA